MDFNLEYLLKWLDALVPDRERRDVADAVSRPDFGARIRLSRGYVHYRFTGPENGPVAVCVHGFSAPMIVWEKTAEALAAAGFRVLCFDLYGRGFSDRPRAVYNENLFDGELCELLDALAVKEPVHLLGLSMGGAISAIFTARHPERVRRLVLIAPAGTPVDVPFVAKLSSASIIGSLFMRLFGSLILEKGASQVFYRTAGVPEFMEKYKAQMEYKGFRRAILDTLVHFDLSDQAASYARVGRLPLPVLLVWGDRDTVVPYANHSMVCSLVPQAKFLSVEAVGHMPHFEKAETVNPAIVEFLTAGD